MPTRTNTGQNRDTIVTYYLHSFCSLNIARILDAATPCQHRSRMNVTHLVTSDTSTPTREAAGLGPIKALLVLAFLGWTGAGSGFIRYMYERII